MIRFRADDGELVYLQVSGEGSPVVMLHGWTSSHGEWSPFVDILATRHRLFRWDARSHGGHGLTRPTLPSVGRMARDLRNLLEHFALERAVLVGHSMGALTIWEYVRHWGTEGLAKLCLIDQSPRQPRSVRRAAAAGRPGVSPPAGSPRCRSHPASSGPRSP